MSYLDIYRKRILANGTKSTDTIVNASKASVKNNFNNSLFSETVLIDGIQFNGIVSQGKTNNDKKLLLIPDTKVDIGSIVEINNNNYLIMDFNGEGINEIYPTATLQLCNSLFPIKSNKTRVLIGRDDDQRPIYYEDFKPTFEPVIVSSTFLSVNDNAQLPLPEGRLDVTMRYIESDDIKINSTFEMYNNTYKIIDIDYTKVIKGKGIILIRAKRDVVK